MTRDQILDALQAWINQRPGLDPANYFGSGNYRENLANYRSESRRITQQLHDARKLLAAVRWRTSIDVEQLKDAFRAYSGRLTLTEHSERHTAETCPGRPCSTECDHVEAKGCSLSYCTGQYWPTEYRAAACAVLASALWDYTRANMPAPIGKAQRHGYETEIYAYNSGRLKLSAGDWIRTSLRREFGANLQRRWMD